MESSNIVQFLPYLIPGLCLILSMIFLALLFRQKMFLSRSEKASLRVVAIHNSFSLSGVMRQLEFEVTEGALKGQRSFSQPGTGSARHYVDETITGFIDPQSLETRTTQTMVINAIMHAGMLIASLSGLVYFFMFHGV